MKWSLPGNRDASLTVGPELKFQEFVAEFAFVPHVVTQVSFSTDLSSLGIELWSLVLQADSLLSELPGKGLIAGSGRSPGEGNGNPL